MNSKVIKIIGVTVTVTGALLSLISNWVDDKKLDMKIDEKIADALNSTKGES